MTGAPIPASIQTSRGPVEYVTCGDGPTVLALHGAMGGWDQSLLLARTIGEPGYRVVALSRPGYLGTALAAGRTPEEQADLYAETLDALGTSQAAVMAVSGGGPSAIHLALRHPDRCWGLVLVSTCGTKVESRLPLSFYLFKLLARRPWFVAALRRRAERDPERAARASILDPALRERTLADPEAGPLFRALMASTADRMAMRMAGTLNDVEVTRSRDYPPRARGGALVPPLPGRTVRGASGLMTLVVSDAEAAKWSRTALSSNSMAGPKRRRAFASADPRDLQASLAFGGIAAPARGS